MQQIIQAFRCICSLGYFLFLINLVKGRPLKQESNNLKEQYRAKHMLKHDFQTPVLKASTLYAFKRRKGTFNAFDA